MTKDTATYIVAWTGGFETPDYFVSTNLAEATEAFESYLGMAHDDSEFANTRIELLVILPGENRVLRERVEGPMFEDAL